LQIGRFSVIFTPAMNFPSILSGVLITASSLSLVGCGSTKVTSTHEASVGQQLTDLENARAQGIITEDEHKRLKKALIKRYD
jgi:hypothetical protein